MVKKEPDFRKRIYDIIQIGSREDVPSRLADYVIASSIVINIICLFAGTFSIPPDIDRNLDMIESVTVGIFILEYILRVWTADFYYTGISPAKARFKYVFSFFGLVDLLSILPYFIAMLPWGMVAFRILRIFRIFRLFKINAQSDAFNIVIDVLRAKSRQIMSSVAIVLTMMLAASLLMYGIEHEAQPEVFKNAFSGLWWSVSTLLTVGYGDIYPITTLGRIVAIILSFMGVGLVAIPTGIISAGFVEYYTRMKPLDDVSQGNDLQFFSFGITEDHPYAWKRIEEISVAPEIMVVAVIRGNNVITPRGNTQIKPGDELIMGCLAYKNEHGIRAREFMIDDTHPWNGEYLWNLQIPEDMVVVSVIRHGKAMIPKGSTVFMPGDVVSVCERRMQKV
ncbi:MAG: ion transporter [Lachnospiraceae bacterium]|nr:ion transporter [Lachnospiraceae bacterium]